MAISSAMRSGFSWMGNTLPKKAILPFLVVRASTDPITFTDGIMHNGLLWCSLIMTPSKPDSVQYWSSSKYIE